MTAEAIALFVAGLVASPFIQFVKERLGITGAKALWLSWGLSLILAAIALFVTGELSLGFVLTDPLLFFTQLGEAFVAVFGLATIIYKAKFAPAA